MSSQLAIYTDSDLIRSLISQVIESKKNNIGKLEAINRLFYYFCSLNTAVVHCDTTKQEEVQRCKLFKPTKLMQWYSHEEKVN